MDINAEHEPLVQAPSTDAPTTQTSNVDASQSPPPSTSAPAIGSLPSHGERASSPATSTRSLKRSAEMMEEDDGGADNAGGANPSTSTNEGDSADRQEAKRKRLSGNQDDAPSEVDKQEEGDVAASSSKLADSSSDGTDTQKLVDEMGVELTCGCCSALCYNPVIVLPCQHYYCGSCYTLWTRNGGVNCPSCRSPVTSIIPCRAIQNLIEAYIRAVPSSARLQREKEQADEVYAAGQAIAVPAPRSRSPELPAPQDHEAYFHPCPHCPSPNDFNWSCPVPIISPAVNLTFATLLTSPTFPAGHARCGSCDHIHANRAPTTSKCDFCGLSFCGLVAPTRCNAKRPREQRPKELENVMDMLGNPDIYNAFGINAVEFDYLLDHLSSREISPRAIYAEIVESLQRNNDGWRPLLDRGLFPVVTAREQAAAEAAAATAAATEAAQPPPVATTSSPPEGSPSSPSRSPETVVNETMAPENPEPASAEQDQEMAENEGARPAEETPSSATPLETPASAAPVATPENQAQTTAGSAEEANMQVDERERPATPLAVPDRQVTPPIPEPILDALPVDVEAPADTTPVVAAGDQQAVPVNITEEPNQQERNASNNASDNSDDEDDDDEGSRSPPPVNENANATGENPESNTANGSQNGSSRRNRSNGLNKICRACAVTVLLWGARSWWIKERARAVETWELADNVANRPDCPDMANCTKEDDNAHAREFNHIPNQPIPKPRPPPPPSADPESTNEQEQVVGDQSNANANVDRTPDSVEAVTSDSSGLNNRSSSPERPETNPPAPNGMDLDVSTEGQATSAEEHQAEVIQDAVSVPELAQDSPTHSLPSTSSDLSAAVQNNADDEHMLDNNGEYSEKGPRILQGNGDVQMHIHEGEQPQVTTAATTATIA